MHNGCYEPEPETFEAITSLLLNACDGCEYLDIGCNMGIFASHAAALGARVRCYEPSAVYRESLQRTSQEYSSFEYEQVAVSATVDTGTLPASLFARGYKPCNVGRATVNEAPVPVRSIAKLIAQRRTHFMKIDIDSTDGALLHTATNMIETGEAVIDTILIELGTGRLAFLDRPENLRNPRGGDVHDLWRLQQLGYDVYRINVGTNMEVYDWKGDDVNQRHSRQSSSFLPLHFIRGMRKLELLLPHNSSRAYGQYVNWGQSYLITRVQLVERKLKVGSDMKHATPRSSIAALNAGNPAVAERASCSTHDTHCRWAMAAAIRRGPPH